jgi:hypothetical protein
LISPTGWPTVATCESLPMTMFMEAGVGGVVDESL